jgi:peptide/nickel transport system permease protein
MLGFLVRRLWQSAVVLVIVSMLVFVIVFAMGDPARAFVPINASPEDVENIRHQFGLDQPIWIQYLVFIQHAATGDMGESFKFHQPAMGLVLQRLPLTGALAIASIVFAAAVSLPLGVIAAVKHGRAWDHVATGIAVLSVSVPTFWLGILLILFVAGQLRWLPASGANGASSIVLPALTLSAYSIGLITRLTRTSMLGEVRQPYVVTARAKGLSESTMLNRHALRNALLPIVTIVGLQFGILLGGSVIVETVFAWPGVGWLMIQAIQAHDLPLLRANVLVIAIVFLVINASTDVAYAFLNPRIRFG